jgi:hypothetical protein
LPTPRTFKAGRNIDSVIIEIAALDHDVTQVHPDAQHGFVTLSGSIEQTAVDVLSGSNARSGTPCLKGLGAEPALRCRRDEMTTDVESVVDRSMR